VIEMSAVRVNEKRSRLNGVLSGYLRAEFWRAVEADVGADPRTWPSDVRERILLEETQWRTDHGRIAIVARTYACVEHDKHHYCVLQLTYRDAGLPAPALKDAAPGQAGGSDQVDAAAPARPISPSLCGIRHGAGWNDLAEE
jgi:hypothetical protein